MSLSTIAWSLRSASFLVIVSPGKDLEPYPMEYPRWSQYAVNLSHSYLRIISSASTRLVPTVGLAGLLELALADDCFTSGCSQSFFSGLGVFFASFQSQCIDPDALLLYVFTF